MHRRDEIVLVIDDGGIPYENPDKTGFAVPFTAYEAILRLAESLQIRIPIAVTAGFIDIFNISGLNLASDYASRLVDFLRKNNDYLPVWCHGLTHQWENSFTEFDVYDKSSKPVPADSQKQRLELCRAIFVEAGLKAPEVLVPPGHAWQPGVTDKLAKETGFKAIAIREFEKTSFTEWMARPDRPFKSTWNDSAYLNTLYRLGLGIPYNKRKFYPWDYWKSRQYIYSSNKLVSGLVNRKFSVKSPHHFFAHVQNFCMPESYRFWEKVVKELLKRYSQ
ncbi:MAG: hypothetical protein ACLFV2_01925 [Desulfurivibrionaceae bacterium]